MIQFGLIVVGAHNGFWLENEVNKFKRKAILIEPVKYNFEQLKERFASKDNIFFENIAISKTNETKPFYYVRGSSVSKLKKHWASGIGSFSKEHILNHRTKRFLITSDDIEEINLSTIKFNDLLDKYTIKKLDKLIIDTEGYDDEIIRSIDFNKVDISEIQLEKKHLGGTFETGSEEKKLISFLLKHNFAVVKTDVENIFFKKN
jgi:FkbM family methyltransferase